MYYPSEVTIFDESGSPRFAFRVTEFDGNGLPHKIRVFSPVSPLIPFFDLEGSVLTDFANALNSILTGEF